VTVSVPEVFAFVTAGEEEVTGSAGVADWLESAEELEVFRIGCRCRSLGAGKFDFLSMASTVR
jgi:hypothetical protein